MTQSNQHSREDSAEAKAHAAASHRPSGGCWGFESWADVHPSMGGGQGGFSWFERQEEMFEFIGAHLAFFPRGGSGSPEMAQEASSVMRRISKGELSFEDGRIELNRCMKGHWQFEWLGEFNDLISGDRPFERRIRARHRGADEGSSNREAERPIEESEIESFIDETIELYGV